MEAEIFNYYNDNPWKSLTKDQNKRTKQDANKNSSILQITDTSELGWRIMWMLQ